MFIITYSIWRKQNKTELKDGQMLNVKSNNFFQLYYGENILCLTDLMICLIPDLYLELKFYSATIGSFFSFLYSIL